MRQLRFADWIQILTGLGVLFGLGLVIWELQQAREIAKAQQVSESFSRYSQRLQAMMGEESARAVAKACTQPDDLEIEDMLVLDKYYIEVVNSVRVAYQMSRTASALAVFDWRPWLPSLEEIFRTKYGRFWWRNRYPFEEEIWEEGNRLLAEFEINDCPEYWSEYFTSDGR